LIFWFFFIKKKERYLFFFLTGQKETKSPGEIKLAAVYWIIKIRLLKQ